MESVQAAKPIYQKPAFWIILIAILATVAVAVCYFASRKTDQTPVQPVNDAVVQWLDFENDFSEIPWDSVQEWTAEAFPNVTFLWNSGVVEAKEDGKTRTLFSGMPITNVYLADLTGDGKPELCATVYFGSGVVDSHIIAYDYVNKQGYALWNRMEYDYHLYMENGRLLIGRTPYHSGFPSGDIQTDTGTLVLQNGRLFVKWQSDGSQTPLMRFLHESDLYGEWIVMEERDGEDNLLYTQSIDLWKEYNFKEDGTVVYNETNPVSSVYEQAFGHPVSYPYTVRDNDVYLDEDNAEGFFRYGYLIDRNSLEIVYQTSPGKYVHAKLKRMGSDAD